MYTASTALLETLRDADVSYIFANFGSDHPALIEAIAEARAEGKPIPKIITCPNEMVALSAAHGYAQVTGRAQAVVVHVECGTQSLAGAVHNAAKARVPVFIFAGTSPFTQEGELKGSRNEFIQWIQDVPDQRGIVRQYMKYDNELRSARNLPQIVLRALQIAHSDPKGPVYVVGAREVMEEHVSPALFDPDQWSPVGSTALRANDAAEIAERLSQARRPLLVTSYFGRRPAEVPGLVRLCRRIGMGVLESVPSCVNYPHDDEFYQGNQWNEPRQNPALAEADVILVLDSDVPWIPTVSRPAESAWIYHIDVDPLKPSTPLWYIGALLRFQADAGVAISQLNAYLDGKAADPGAVEERRRHYAARHHERAARLAAREVAEGGVITPEFLTACLRRQLGDDWIVLNEGITNYPVICDHMARSRPGSMIASGGGSLGWSGRAAIGVKLAHPPSNVAVLTGDGSYMFSQPSTVHWMARRYKTPFLQVIYNNRGWKAPKLSTLAVHPAGYASRAEDIGLSFDPPPDYAGIAKAAGGANARMLKDPAEVEAGIAEAIAVVREDGRAAVLDCWLAPL